MPQDYGYEEEEVMDENMMEEPPMPDEQAPSMEQIQAPQPTTPFSVIAIKGLVGQLNATKNAFAGEGVLPDVEFAAPGDGSKKWAQPIPVEVFAPLTLVVDAVKQIRGGEFSEKYDLDPSAIVDDASLRQASGQLRKMETDKKLVNAMHEGVEQAMGASEMPGDMEGPEGAPMSMDEMSEEDQALMDGMR